LAITRVAVGTVATGITATVTPGLPAGFFTDDIHVCLVNLENTTAVSFPAGWTQKIALNNTLRTEIWWRRAVAGDTGPAISGAGLGIVARIVGYRGCTRGGDPFSAFGSQANAASTTDTAPAITPLEANDMILFAGSALNLAAMTFSAYSGTNPTFSEAMQNDLTGDTNHIAGFLADGIKTDATTTGTRTATISVSSLNNGALLSLSTDPIGMIAPGPRGILSGRT
jgi:hypothetical protein